MEITYPTKKNLHQLFEEQVQRCPGEMAASFKNQSLTYGQLNAKANSVGFLLREKGVSPDGIVGVMMDRSLEMMVGIYGILKAGGAYLPLSPSTPVKRLVHIIHDSGIRFLLAQKRFKKNVDEMGTGVDVIEIDIENEDIFRLPNGDLPAAASPDNLVYVIYTSGSTGQPKGVMIQHGALINRLAWMHKKYPIDESDTILQKTPFFFDVSVWEMFWWSLVGAKVCFLVPGGEKFPQAIVETVEKSGVTVMHFVPSMMSVFLDYLRNSPGDVERMGSLKKVFASGESLIPAHVNAFSEILYKPNGTHLINLYGPTEATVDVTYYDCPLEGESERIPIGKPIDNIEILILVENSRVAEVGEMGELYIGGAGVARGYLNKPEMTAERFVLKTKTLFEKRVLDSQKLLLINNNLNNSFYGVQGRFLQKEPLGTFYRTGDLARWLPDGNIEFLGRVDHQVKIHGFRIELGEIEAVIGKLPGVRDCVVTVKQFSKNITMIVAYMIFHTGFQPVPKELKASLKEMLPEYMVPGIFISMDHFPVTPSGKVDRKALPDPASAIHR